MELFLWKKDTFFRTPFTGSTRLNTAFSNILAHAMSTNEFAAASLKNAKDAAAPPSTVESTIRYLAVTKTERRQMEAVLKLLLQRGADPNASVVPLPPLITAIKATDVEMVKLLLQKGADPNIGMPDGSIFALHLAAGISGESTDLLMSFTPPPPLALSFSPSFLPHLRRDWDVLRPLKV